MDERAYVKAKVDLFNILGNLSYRDYRRTNYNKHGKKYRKHRPYSLSEETQEAQKIYDIVFFNNHDEITLQQEEKVKGYLLNIRIFNTRLLEDRGGRNYFSKSIEEVNLQFS